MSTVEIASLPRVLDETPPAIRAILWLWEKAETADDYSHIRALMTGAYCAIDHINKEHADQYDFLADFCTTKIELMLDRGEA